MARSTWASERALDRGEIKVYTVPVYGSEEKEIVIRAVIDVEPSRIWPLISDCQNFKNNRDGILESDMLSRNGDQVICRVTVDLPWPVSNLTSVTNATHTVKDGFWQRKWYLLKGDYITNQGSWTLTYFKDNPRRTLVEYRLLVVPDSWVPDWIRRKAQKSALPGVIESMREQLGVAK
jgi:hypothetical protein